MTNLYSLGLDLGKFHDYTALSWAQYFPKGCGTHRYNVEPPSCCHVRRIERFPLNVNYPTVINYIVQIIQILQKKGEIVAFYWDGTGNEAFTDYMDKAIDENHLQVNGIPFKFTGGQDGTKMQLISNMKATQIDWPTNPQHPGKNEIEQMHIRMLVEEMKRYEDRRLTSGKIELGVFDSGEHDDMVVSCALAVNDFTRTIEKGAFIGVVPNSNKWVETPMGTAGDFSEAGMGYIVNNVNVPASDFPF